MHHSSAILVILVIGILALIFSIGHDSRWSN
jgi:hypothetical protein